MEKKLRFGDLVRASGRPQVVTLWTDPKKDPAMVKAVRQNRVLTVIQESRGQRDYGYIGLKRHEHAAYMVFPRPLPPNGCVIGINYQLVEEPAVTDPVSAKDLKPKPLFSKPKPKPPQRQFRITVRRTATREDTLAVKAPDQEAAVQRAMATVKRKPFKVKADEVQEEIAKVE